MTNKALLKACMAKFSDTQSTLSAAMGVSLSCLNAKINQAGGVGFKQSEISFIRERYGLTSDDVDRVFFARELS